jgi:methionine-rich copper-binding protein CopC
VTQSKFVVALLVCLVSLQGTPVAAHNQLLRAVPKQGASLTSAPSSVLLTFDDSFIGGNEINKVIVTNAAGTKVNSGNSSVAANTLTLALPTLPNGIYTVNYRVVSADGHPVSGGYQFKVAVPEPTNSKSKVIGLGRYLTTIQIVKSAGLTLPSKATVTLSVAKASNKFCKVSRSKVFGTKAGNCKISVTITPKLVKGKPKPKSTSVAVTYQVK